MKKLLAGIILATLFFVIGIFLISKKNTIQTANPVVKQPTNLQVPTPTIDAPPPIQSRETTVTFTASGFSPKIITVYPGTILTLENKSGKNATVASIKYPPLNLGEIKNGEHASLVFDKAGIYPYNASSYSATVVVVNK